MHKILNSLDYGILMHLEFLHVFRLLIFRKKKAQHFGNWVCIHAQVKSFEITRLVASIIRPNLFLLAGLVIKNSFSHWAQFILSR